MASRKRRSVIDLSEEDADTVDAFVYYLYNLNYDAPLFREDRDYFSLHVQMCIMGDKYDMRPLQDLTVERFKKQTIDISPTESNLATAAFYAYDAAGATTEIRKMIVELAIDKKLIPNDIRAEPANDFERALQTCPGMCLDIVKVQQTMITPVPKSYNCPSCKLSCDLAITVSNVGRQFHCWHCRFGYAGFTRAQYPEY